MHLVEEFKSYADQCRRMGRSTPDPDTRLMWNRMADRWLRLADDRQKAEQHARESHEPRRMRTTRYQHIYGQ